MIRVANAASPLHAQLMVGVLAEHGISACVQGEALWGARGELPLSLESSPSVWVVDELEVERARQILVRHNTRANPAHCGVCGYNLRGLGEPRCPECGTPFRVEGMWTCPRCTEELGTQFTHCWKCGAERIGVDATLPETSNVSASSKPSQRNPNCALCNDTGRARRRLLPGIIVLVGLFVALAAAMQLFQYVSLVQYASWSGEVLTSGLLLLGLSCVLLLVARQVRSTRCRCQQQPDCASDCTA
jgi:hypothetical protein